MSRHVGRAGQWNGQNAGHKGTRGCDGQRRRPARRERGSACSPLCRGSGTGPAASKESDKLNGLRAPAPTNLNAQHDKPAAATGGKFRVFPGLGMFSYTQGCPCRAASVASWKASRCEGRRQRGVYGKLHAAPQGQAVRLDLYASLFRTFFQPAGSAGGPPLSAAYCRGWAPAGVRPPADPPKAAGHPHHAPHCRPWPTGAVTAHPAQVVTELVLNIGKPRVGKGYWQEQGQRPVHPDRPSVHFCAERGASKRFACWFLDGFWICWKPPLFAGGLCLHACCSLSCSLPSPTSAAPQLPHLPRARVRGDPYARARVGEASHPGPTLSQAKHVTALRALAGRLPTWAAPSKPWA